MDDLLNSEAAKRAIRELTIAFIATVITLLFAVGLYFLVPRLKIGMGGANPELMHKRKFTALPDGGQIEYVAPPRTDRKKQLIAAYKQDLEILSRRFQRGKFEMVFLPGFRASAVSKKISRHVDDYEYSVTATNNSVILNIKSEKKEANQALHEYLKYLKKRWKHHR